jgi:hypothetical protein
MGIDSDALKILEHVEKLAEHGEEIELGVDATNRRLDEIKEAVLALTEIAEKILAALERSDSN